MTKVQPNSVRSYWAVSILWILVLAMAVSAQKIDVDVTNTLSPLQHYVSIARLSSGESKVAFAKMSPVDKAKLFRFQLAVQFVNRTNLSAPQVDAILKTISVLTNDAYKMGADRNTVMLHIEIMEQIARPLFSESDYKAIFSSLSGSHSDISIVSQYLDLITNRKGLGIRTEFQRMSALEKSNVWKTHLAFKLSQMNNLNEYQQKLIVKAIGFVTPYRYEIKGNVLTETADDHLTVFNGEASGLFSRAEFNEIFTRLGNDYDYPELDQSCTCRTTSSGECSASTTCAGGGCESTWFGCGTAWMQSCNGECRR